MLDIYILIGTTVTVLVVAFAFLKGDETERIGGAAFALVTLATMFIPEDRGLTNPLWGRMGLDSVLLAVFLGLGWHSRRAWPMWAAGFQALIVTGHVLVVANLRPQAAAFATVNNMANYGLLIAMAVGTFWAWQERRAASMGSETARSPRL